MYNFDCLLELLHKQALYEDVAIINSVYTLVGKIYKNILENKDFTRNEYYEIINFIGNLFMNLNIIPISIIKKGVWLLDMVLEDYQKEYFGMVKVRNQD